MYFDAFPIGVCMDPGHIPAQWVIPFQREPPYKTVLCGLFFIISPSQITLCPIGIENPDTSPYFLG
ncbi:MAG TPA: hypothetical protein DCE41_04270 [Cytophagales bacterium]|nr:hypothetical protein [Cytophagales bacterium]